MPIRDSKRALAEVAALLGTDAAKARSYLRSVQHLAGPVPYDRSVAAMRLVEGHDPQRVAEVVTREQADSERTGQ